MTDHTVKKCPKCGQQLRFPENIGGMLMACPSCGNKFHSDFKLGSNQSTQIQGHRNLFTDLFEMPYRIVRRIGRYFSSKQ
jgi:DNA-directed RNA polymerase subunit RPC12/RpoP